MKKTTIAFIVMITSIFITLLFPLTHYFVTMISIVSFFICLIYLLRKLSFYIEEIEIELKSSKHESNR